MIQGYPDQSSVFPGDTLVLHVSTDAPEFQVAIYRQGATLTQVLTSGWSIGQDLPNHPSDQDWGKDGIDGLGNVLRGWPAFEYVIPDGWSSGVYIAMFVEGDGSGNPRGNTPPLDAGQPDSRSGKSLFVVKNPNPGMSALILYKLPLLTYQAYNSEGGWSLYQRAPVSLHRPGGGTGGTPWDIWNYDPADASSPRQVFAHWDVPFIAWLEQNGYLVDYCTDVDIDQDDHILDAYALLLSVGHDEYWTDNMRDRVQAFRDNGGNAAFFSGNTCWWHAQFDDAVTFRRTGLWSDPNALNNPENSLTGVSYRNAGEADQVRPKIGYVVQHHDHWVFEGTGLAEGDVVGAGDELVGYECDGANFDRSQTLPVTPTVDDGTPSSFIILGVGDVSNFAEADGNKAATMGIYTEAGTVFTAATTDWPRVLGINQEPYVQTISRNVLNRLGGQPTGLATLTNATSLLAVDGLFTPDDDYRHAIIAQRNGDIHEVFYHPTIGIHVSQPVLANFTDIVDIAAFFSPDDNYRHVIAAQSNGDIYEVFFHPAIGVHIAQPALANFGCIIAVSAFFTPDDNYRHVIVAQSNGDIHEVFYHPTIGIHVSQPALANFTGIVDIAAFFSPDDNYRHVIVGTDDGNVYELFYHPAFGQGQALLSRLDGIVTVSAFYADSDAYFNRRVIVCTKVNRVHEVKFSPKAGVIRSVLWNTNGVVDMGGFFSPDDDARHVILARVNGDVEELYYFA